MIHGENRLINKYIKYSCSPKAPTSCDDKFSVLCHVAGGEGGVHQSEENVCLWLETVSLNVRSLNVSLFQRQLKVLTMQVSR